MSKIYMRYASDLHLEMYGEHHDLDLLPINKLWNFNSNKTDTYYLALVGDIGNPFHLNLSRFFDKIANKYKHIFYIAGNHEYYSIEKIKNNINDHKKEISILCQKYQNIYFMDNDIITIDGINFIGSTLWTNIPQDKSEIVKKSMNDYRYIYNNDKTNITIENTNNWNAESINFIKKSLELVDGPIVILTHHAPLFNNPQLNILCADQKYNTSDIIYAFHNDLDWILDESYDIMLWIYGHTHYSNKFTHKNIIFATNQLGYQYENTGYGEFSAIELNELILGKFL